MSNEDKRALYAGRRVSGRDVVQAFILEDGREIFFKGVRGVVLGHYYACKSDNKMPVRPVQLGGDRRDDPSWEAKDALAEAHLEHLRFEKRLRASARPAWKAAVSAVSPLLKGLSHLQRVSLVDKLLSDSIEKLGKK